MLNNYLSAQLYDEFRCIADQCPFTCCEDWDIAVDPVTYHKWESNNQISESLNKNIRSKKQKRKTEYFIKMNTKKTCPFLNKDELCSLVLQYGEEYIPNTCRVFPRVENIDGNGVEHSLSCACPEVVDMLNRNNKSIQIIYNPLNGEIVDKELKKEHSSNSSIGGLRGAMISLLQRESFSLKDRIILTFHMLLTIKEDHSNIAEIIDRYHEEQYLKALTALWSEVINPKEDSFYEVSELLLDIVQNYRKHRKYHQKLQSIAELIEELVEGEALNTEVVDAITCINQYQTTIFSKYIKLMENCMVTKIFANCTSDDIDEIIMAYQVIITEYVMVRHSSYLKWFIQKRGSVDSLEEPVEEIKKSEFHNTIALNSEEQHYLDIRDYIVVYSRIIEYNSDGMKEFWEDSFDDSVWELGYLLLLMD